MIGILHTSNNNTKLIENITVVRENPQLHKKCICKHNTKNINGSR